jgi:ATP-dependent protease ClpP protease subunit
MRTPPSDQMRALRAAWRAGLADIEARDWACFRVANASADRAKLYVYDMIGGFDNDAADFVQAVHGLNAKAIDLHINSPGGFVYDAVAMYEALKAHPATVHTTSTAWPRLPPAS